MKLDMGRQRNIKNVVKRGGHCAKSNRDSVRKAREAYLIERGQTLEPHGLNRKDET